MNAYLDSCPKDRNESGYSNEPTKNSVNETPTKEASFEKIETNSTKPQVEDADTSESWTSNIFSKISSWLSKELTVFCCKCSEQDKELNWWSRAGKWVRDAEKLRSGTPSQQLYFEEYQNLKGLIEKNYSVNPNDSIDTITCHKFELQQIQIEKDIDRTLSGHPYFGSGKEGQEHLRVLLKILALKYTDIGYVQGMNFLVVSLLYHCSPEITLFLITVLIEDYELCDVYRVDVTGLHQRNGVIKTLVEQKLKDVHDHFIEIGIDPQMFTTEWVLDLFSHIIPLNFYGKFLDNFIHDGSINLKENKGWKYFYQVVISILLLLQKDLVQKWEWDEVLVFIKNYVKDKNSSINWDKVLNMAKKP